MKTLIALILITACTKTQVVQAPTVPTKQNHAADLVKLVKPFKDLDCKPWTGAGTAFAGLDSYVCQTPTTLIWCVAPGEGPPKCVTTVDWTPPPPSAPVEQPKPAPEAPKSPAKK